MIDVLSGLFPSFRYLYLAVLTAGLLLITASLLACGGEEETPTSAPATESPTGAAVAEQPATEAATPEQQAADTPVPDPSEAGSAPNLALPTVEQLGGGSPDLFIKVFEDGREGSSFRPTSEFAAAAQPLAEGEKLKVGIIFVGSQQDLGWNQAAATGADYLEQVFDDVEVLRAENILETVDVQAVAEQMIEQGATIVIPTSFGYSDPIKAIIDKHPEVMFLHLGDLEIFENYGSFFANIWQLEYAAGKGRREGDHQQQDRIHRRLSHPVQSAEHQRLPPGSPVGQPRRGDHGGVHQPLVRSGQAGYRGIHHDRRRGRRAVAATGLHQDGGRGRRAGRSMGHRLPLRRQRCRSQLLDHWRHLELGPDNGPGGARDSHRHLPEFGQAGRDRCRLGQAGLLRRCAVDEETQQLVLDTVEGLRDGSISPFTGPIHDQDGEVRIAEGETATDEYLQTVDWLAQGIVGRTN